MKRIAFYSHEFRLCEWPSEPKDQDYYHNESGSIAFAEALLKYEKAVTSAMENGVRFEDQEKVKHHVFMNCLKDRGGISVSHVWQPKEGDNWPAPEGAEIVEQDNHIEGYIWKTSKVAVLKSESVEEEDYLKIPSGTAIKRAKAKLEKAGRPEDFPWPAKDESVEKKESVDDVERIEAMIATIELDGANLQHIAKIGKINGNLLVELRRIFTENNEIKNAEIKRLTGNLEAYIAAWKKCVKELARLNQSTPKE